MVSCRLRSHGAVYMLACAPGGQPECWPAPRESNLHAGLCLMGTTYMPIYAIRGILGPRTKSWTLGSGLEVRMRDGETVGLFLLAREEGMGFAEAAEFAGVAPPDRREVGRRAAAALRSRRALQMARLGRAVPREPPGEEHVPQGQELRQRPHGGLLRHAQVGVLPQPGLGGGRPDLIPSTFFSPIAQMNRHRSRQRIFTGSANGLSPFSAILRPSSRAAGPSAGRTCP